MSFTALPVTAAERFAWIMNALLIAIGRPARSPLLAGFLVPVYRRIQRTRNRVLRLIARIEAGTLPQPRDGRRPAAPRQMDEPARRRLAEQAKIWGKLPRQPGWLLALAHWDVAGLAGQLAHLLTDEAMQRALAATPRMATALRSMCRMLGIDPALLGEAAAPRRARRRAAKPAAGEPAAGRRRQRHRTRRDEPSAAAITAEINRRRWPSIEQQARPDRYRWTPTEPADPGGADEKSRASAGIAGAAIVDSS